MTENDISYIIRGGIFSIYNYFGPGLLESVYKQALYRLIKSKGLSVKKEIGVAASFMETDLGLGFRMDLLVEEKVIIEVKSIDMLSDIHPKQLLTYLRLTNLKLGILVNFNTSTIDTSIIRIVNNL